MILSAIIGPIPSLSSTPRPIPLSPLSPEHRNRGSWEGEGEGGQGVCTRDGDRRGKVALNTQRYALDGVLPHPRKCQRDLIVCVTAATLARSANAMLFFCAHTHTRTACAPEVPTGPQASCPLLLLATPLTPHRMSMHGHSQDLGASMDAEGGPVGATPIGWLTSTKPVSLSPGPPSKKARYFFGGVCVCACVFYAAGGS